MPEQGVAGLNYPEVMQFLLDHIQNANLRLPGVTGEGSPDLTFASNEQFWLQFLKAPPRAWHWVKLRGFRVVDWYPRTPGLYHTGWAQDSRGEAEYYRVEENGVSFYEPLGKMHMIDGGLGSVRFKPVTIEGRACWLSTATSDGYCHTGVPLAIPDRLMGQIGYDYGQLFDITGQVRHLPTFLEEHFTHGRRIPQIHVLVDKIEPNPALPAIIAPVMVSPMLFFTAGPGPRLSEQGNVTYAVCPADSVLALDRASDWMAQYVDRYGKEIITDFDQQRPAFENVPFGLQVVMDGKLDKEWLGKLWDYRPEILSEAFERVNIHIGEIRMGDTFNMSGDFRGAILNIKSTLTNVSQGIGALPHGDAASKDELKQLIDQLNEALQKAPPGKAEDAEAVAESAKILVEKASEVKPNKTMVQITGEGLKQAAKNIADVLPTVLTIATQIVAVVGRIAALA